MKRRREREQLVEPGLLQGLPYGFAAVHEIEVATAALERPGQPQDVSDATKVDEVEFFQVDRYRLGAVAKAVFDSRREVGSGGCFHPPLGPSDKALPLLLKLDLHAVIQCRTVV